VRGRATINAIIGRAVETTEQRKYRPVTARMRKLAGAVVLLVFLAVYALAAMMAAVVLQVSASKTAELLYYPVAGLLWVPPAMWLIRWMQRPDS
jgi:cobalamin biosynthesis protein CobD/CbiB